MQQGFKSGTTAQSNINFDLWQSPIFSPPGKSVCPETSELAVTDLGNLSQINHLNHYKLTWIPNPSRKPRQAFVYVSNPTAKFYEPVRGLAPISGPVHPLRFYPLGRLRSTFFRAATKLRLFQKFREFYTRINCVLILISLLNCRPFRIALSQRAEGEAAKTIAPSWPRRCSAACHGSKHQRDNRLKAQG
jgi:hypothetical protein